MKSILEEKKLYDKYSIILLIIEVLQCLCQFSSESSFFHQRAAPLVKTSFAQTPEIKLPANAAPLTHCPAAG